MPRIPVAGALILVSLGLLAGALTWGATCSFESFGAVLLVTAAVGALAGGALVVWAGRDAGGGAVLAAVVLAVAVAFVALFALFVAVGASCAD
jgi:hypothetical protein